MASCTSKNESLELIKLGIDQDTADSIYIEGIDVASYLPGVKFGVIKERLIKEKGYQENAIIPAWTTDALLSLLPLKIRTFQLLIFPDLTTNMWVCMYDKMETHDEYLEACGDPDYHKTIYKMVCWYLKENKKLDISS